MSPTLDQRTQSLRRRPRLCARDGAAVREHAIAEPTTVGSAEGAPLRVADRTVSRLHAALEPREDGLWVRDLGSKNGTFVNDVRVVEARVPPGGSVRFGAASFLVSYDLEPSLVELWPEDSFGPLLGGSAPMRELFASLGKLAPSDVSVLVRGETGTGKELVARALHQASPRAAHPFVVVDCAAMPDTLLETELFGHAKGAFTGASQAREGAIEAADGGVVFLDEIGELGLSLQPKLLRVLESRQLRRLGETAYRPVDVRFVSATHRDLRRMVNEGTFREDLYFRLAVLEVRVPPLRERAEDTALLLRHLLGAAAHLVTDEVLGALSARPWPGNVRELRNFAERLRVLGPDAALARLEEKLSTAPPPGPGAEARAEEKVAAPTAAAAGVDEPTFALPLRLDVSYREAREEALERFERAYFAALLARHGRNVAAAARAIGVDRTYIYKLIKRHEL